VYSSERRLDDQEGCQWKIGAPHTPAHKQHDKMTTLNTTSGRTSSERQAGSLLRTRGVSAIEKRSAAVEEEDRWKNRSRQTAR
jgi:hypothetical protein